MSQTEQPTDELNAIRSEIRAEIGLLNSRLNALISAQSFLVIAYGSALSSSFGEWRTLFTLTLPPFLALLGFVLVWEARPGLRAAHEALQHWRQREAALIDAREDLQPYTLATDKDSRRHLEDRQRAGNVFPSHAPAILLTAWTVFFLMPFVLWVWG